MAHRLGDGTKIDDIEAARAEWRAGGRSPSTYPNKGEFDQFQEDLGELSHTYEDGRQLRRHATLKTTTRGGRWRIAHNVTIEHDPRTGRNIFCPDKDHDEMLRQAQGADNSRTARDHPGRFHQPTGHGR